MLAKYSNLDDIEKFVGETPELRKELGKFQDITEKNYAEVFRRLNGLGNGEKEIGGKLISQNFEIHHCFPQSIFKDGAEGADFIKETGININDPRLLVWWEESNHVQKAKEYNEKIISILEKNKGNNKKTIAEIRKLMGSYGFDVQF